MKYNVVVKNNCLLKVYNSIDKAVDHVKRIDNRKDFPKAFIIITDK